MTRNRLDAARARTDTRDWAVARRERTRHLIELGGLVDKAGLVELTNDDRATLLGALLEAAGRLRGVDGDEEPARLRARWRHAGLRAFHAEREADAAAAASTADAARSVKGGGTAGEPGVTAP